MRGPAGRYRPQGLGALRRRAERVGRGCPGRAACRAGAGRAHPRPQGRGRGARRRARGLAPRCGGAWLPVPPGPGRRLCAPPAPARSAAGRAHRADPGPAGSSGPGRGLPFLDRELGPVYARVELEARGAQNQFWREQLLLIVGGVALTVLGVVQTALTGQAWPGIVEAVIGGLISAVALRARELNARERYMGSRLKAERLKSEYFLYLARSDYASEPAGRPRPPPPGRGDRDGPGGRERRATAPVRRAVPALARADQLRWYTARLDEFTRARAQAITLYVASGRPHHHGKRPRRRRRRRPAHAVGRPRHAVPGAVHRAGGIRRASWIPPGRQALRRRRRLAPGGCASTSLTRRPGRGLRSRRGLASTSRASRGSCAASRASGASSRARRVNPPPVRMARAEGPAATDGSASPHRSWRAHLPPVAQGGTARKCPSRRA